MISDDAKETWIVINLKKAPDDWRTNQEYLNYLQNKGKIYPSFYEEFNLQKADAPDYMVGKIVDKIAAQNKYKELSPKTTGVPCIISEKRDFFNEETPRLMVLGLIVSIILLVVFLRSWRGVVFPIITALGAMVITLGIEGYFETTVQPSLLPMPLFLGLAVSVGYSIHLFNFFKKEFMKTGIRKEAIIFAVEKTGWPLLFTALTTICALLSFIFLKIRVLNWVGYTTTLIIIITYFLTVIVFPIFLSFGKDKKILEEKNLSKSSIWEERLGSFGKWTINHPKIILIIFLLISIVAIYGLSRVEVDFDSERTMGREIPYINKMLSIGETKIGSTRTYDIGIEFEENDIVKDPEFLNKNLSSCRDSGCTCGRLFCNSSVFNFKQTIC